MDKAAKCKNCARRRMYAICFDVHFDYLDCPFKCEVKEYEND